MHILIFGFSNYILHLLKSNHGRKTKILKDHSFCHMCRNAYCLLHYWRLTNSGILKLPNINTEATIYLLIPVAAIIVGNFLYKAQLKNANPKESPEKNFAIYQTASILRWAILEGAAFVILFLKKDMIIIGVLLILYMAFLRPSEESLKKDLLM